MSVLVEDAVEASSSADVKLVELTWLVEGCSRHRLERGSRELVVQRQDLDVLVGVVHW